MILPPAAANINSLLGSETCRVKNVTCTDLLSFQGGLAAAAGDPEESSEDP